MSKSVTGGSAFLIASALALLSASISFLYSGSVSYLLTLPLLSATSCISKHSPLHLLVIMISSSNATLVPSSWLQSK